MSRARQPKCRPGEQKARVEAQRAEAIRLRAEGLTLAAIGERLGLHHQRVSLMLKPVPANNCRACGGEVERRKRYHPACLPSGYKPRPRPPKPPRGLTGQKFGLWEVLGPGKTQGRWRCRCVCGAEGFVHAMSLRKGTSPGCWRCTAGSGHTNAKGKP